MYRCVSNEAAHHERHRSIAELVDDAKGSDDSHGQSPVGKKRKDRKRKTGDDLPALDESTATENSPSDSQKLHEENGTKIDAKEDFMTAVDKRALKSTTKDRRNQEKALRNQQKFGLSVKQEHITHIARVIHGDEYEVEKIGGCPAETKENATSDDAILNRKDAYNASIQTHRMWLKEQVKGSRSRAGKKGEHARKRQSDIDAQNGLAVQVQEQEQDHDVEGLVEAILGQLGICDHDEPQLTRARAASPAPTIQNRKQRARTIAQLRKEIAEDIKKSQNENRARQQRMEGYWRYVNGKVTDRLAKNAQSVDRATGMKLPDEMVQQRSAEGAEMDREEDLGVEEDGECDEGLEVLEG